MKNKNTTGNIYIKSLRIRLGLSQEQFADRMRVSTSMVCLWEKGKRLPSPPKAKLMIAEAKKHGYKLTFEQIYS